MGKIRVYLGSFCFKQEICWVMLGKWLIKAASPGRAGGELERGYLTCPGAAFPPPPPPQQSWRERTGNVGSRVSEEQGWQVASSRRAVLFSLWPFLYTKQIMKSKKKKKNHQKSLCLRRKVGELALCQREHGVASCFWTIAFLLGAKHVIISFNPHNNSLR